MDTNCFLIDIDNLSLYSTCIAFQYCYLFDDYVLKSEMGTMIYKLLSYTVIFLFLDIYYKGFYA